jgi:hypothetical protein
MMIGCGQPKTTPAVPKAQASYSYEVRHRNGLSQGKAPEFTVTGKHSVSVKSGRLMVNGRDLGGLNDGDSILVDENAYVTVNGSERKELGK